MLHGAQMMQPRGAGVKPAVAHEMLTARRGVPQYALDEMRGAPAGALGAPVAMVGVGHHDVGPALLQRALGQWTALDIARQVQRHTAAVGIALGQVHVPVLAVLAADMGAPVRGGK